MIAQSKREAFANQMETIRVAADKERQKARAAFDAAIAAIDQQERDQIAAARAELMRKEPTP